MSYFSLSNFFVLSIAYILFKVIYQIVYYRWFHPLAKFPGPFWAAVTRLWIAYRNIQGDECQVNLALHKRYGMSLMQYVAKLIFGVNVYQQTQNPTIYNIPLVIISCNFPPS
jgi:hypothetical protein